MRELILIVGLAIAFTGIYAAAMSARHDIPRGIQQRTVEGQ